MSSTPNNANPPERPTPPPLPDALSSPGGAPSADAPTARLAVMLSGSGRTLDNLLHHIQSGDLPASIAVVIASRPCLGAKKAAERGIPVEVVRGEIPPDTLEALLRRYGAEWVVLAGYLRLVRIPPSYRGRVVNIHPALLPDFGGPGMHGRHVHEAVLGANRTVSGCTVHLCDDRYDRGPILLQMTCPVKPDDTPGTLAERVFELEKRAYPAALRTLLAGERPRQVDSGSGPESRGHQPEGPGQSPEEGGPGSESTSEVASQDPAASHQRSKR